MWRCARGTGGVFVVIAVLGACSAFGSGDDDDAKTTMRVDAGSRAPRCERPGAPATIGLADSQGHFDLYADNGPNPALHASFTIPEAAGATPIAGHWTVGAGDTVGWYVGSTSTFFFALEHNALNARVLPLQYGAPGAAYRAFAGDWNGDGKASAGLMLPDTAAHFTKSDDDKEDGIFTYGGPGQDGLPLSGDWDGDEVDGIGLYVPGTGSIFLKNVPGPGNADIELKTRYAGKTFRPIAGDWDGCGPVRVGLYDQATATFHLFRELVDYPAEDTIVLSAFAGSARLPIAGRWAAP